MYSDIKSPITSLHQGATAYTSRNFSVIAQRLSDTQGYQVLNGLNWDSDSNSLAIKIVTTPGAEVFWLKRVISQSDRLYFVPEDLKKDALEYAGTVAEVHGIGRVYPIVFQVGQGPKPFGAVRIMSNKYLGNQDKVFCLLLENPNSGHYFE